MPSTFKWSKTSADNNDADSDINWSEGQSPGTVNDSARAVIAAVANWRDDTGGQLTTGGSSNAYTLTTNSSLTAHADGIRLHFVASFSNTGAATLNVDSLGAKKLRKVTASSTNDTALEADDIRANGHYIVQYDASADSASGAWILLNPALDDFQPLDATLTALAGVTTAADKVIYSTGSDAFSTADFTSYGRSLVAVASEAALKTLVNLEIGTDVQAWDADLDAIAALAKTDGNFIVGNGTTWVAESGSTARASMAAAGTGDANTFTAAQTIQSTDTGATFGPDLILDRNSASPAASDQIGEVLFRGRDSGGNATDYARINGLISDPTNGSEDGRLDFYTMIAGTMTYGASFGAGLAMAGATGGLKGTGTINATEIYVNNVAVLTDDTIGDTVQAQGATLDSLEGLSLASGDILYATAADTLARLAKGTDGQVLTLASGLPSWASAGASGLPYLTATATLDGASVAANSQGTIGTITVTGAASGDAVIVSPSGDNGLLYYGSVTSANTVTVFGVNATGSAINPTSQTYRAIVTNI